MRILTQWETFALRLAGDEDYRGQHQGPDPDYGAPLHDVRGMYGQDFYERPMQEWDSGEPSAMDAISLMHRYRDKPDAKVRIYRAMPMSAAQRDRDGYWFPINKGDWVTTQYDYAHEHGMANLDHSEPSGWTVAQSSVPASSLFTEGNSPLEWAYQGENKLGMEYPHAHGQRYRRKKQGPLA